VRIRPFYIPSRLPSAYMPTRLPSVLYSPFASVRALTHRPGGLPQRPDRFSALARLGFSSLFIHSPCSFTAPCGPRVP
jgi:hypothetical protein